MSDAELIPTFSSFDPTAKGRYHLSIGLNGKQLSFAVLDIAAKEYVALFLQPDSTKALIPKPLSGIEPVSTFAFVRGGMATLVPAGSFQAQHAKKYLDLTHSQASFSQVLHEPIPALPIQLVYNREPGPLEQLETNFPALKVKDARTVLLNAAARAARADRIELHVQVWDDAIDLALFHNGALQLFNSHYQGSHEDVLYHCVFALDRAKLDRNQAHLVLSGKVDGPLQGLMEQYFAGNILAAAPELLPLATELQGSAPHTHRLLYELYQCV